jgi:hypothetical protein
METECEKVPLVARTRIVYPLCGVKPDVETDRRAFAVPPDVRVTLVGFKELKGPFAITGETVEVRLIIPEKPLMLEMVRLDVAEDP